MIHNNDRRFTIGASDTSYVVGNWETKSFEDWWHTKVGLRIRDPYKNKQMLAGTYYETAILNMIPGVKKNGIYRIPELNLTANLDGEVGDLIYEVKTFGHGKEFKVSKTYWRQAQAQMLAKGCNKVIILAYPLTEEMYDNYFIPLDKGKLQKHPVLRDDAFIKDEYIPKLAYVGKCIKEGRFPTNEEYLKQKSKGLRYISED